MRGQPWKGFDFDHIDSEDMVHVFCVRTRFYYCDDSKEIIVETEMRKVICLDVIDAFVFQCVSR